MTRAAYFKEYARNRFEAEIQYLKQHELWPDTNEGRISRLNIGLIDTLAKVCEELESALAQAKADRDENEQVIIRLQKKNAEMRQSLEETREGHDRFLEATMLAERRRNYAAREVDCE